MLEEVKAALRVDGFGLDSEIQWLIDAAVTDLILAGVDGTIAQAMTDPLIKRAVITYCRANFDYADKSAERLQQSYDALKALLSLAEEYRAVTAP